MKVEAIDHINIFVKDLEGAVKRFSDILGTQFMGPLTERKTQDRVAFDMLGFALMAPTSPTSPTAKYINEHGEGVACIGVKVPDIEEAIADLATKGINILERWEGRGHLKTALTDPKNAYGVQFELTEYKRVRPVTIAGLQLRGVVHIPWMSESSNSKMKVEAIDHVHIFVKDDIEAAVKRFSDILGTQFLGPQTVRTSQDKVAFDMLGFEIMIPTLPTSAIAKHIDEHGEGLGPINVKVPDIEEAIAELATKDIGILSRGQVVGPLKVATTDPKNAYGVQFELAEYKRVQPVALAKLQEREEIHIPWMC